MELSGKTALVTGAGSGLGKAAALRLADEGAHIAVLSHTAEEVEQTVSEIKEKGRRALGLTTDVADPDDMKKAFARLKDEFGQLDIVFANAGINGTWAPIDELTVEEWDQTNHINLRGAFLTLHHAVPLMKQKGGSIVITASINGTRTFTTPGASAYATTKAGQLALGQMAAMELAKYGIRVNIICPGAIESEISDNTKQRKAEEAGVEAEYPKGKIPLTGDKKGTAEQVAELVLFLSSPRASHITGTPVWIDGAQSLLV